MNQRSLVTPILITLIYQALMVFYYYIDKFTSGIPFLILFTLILVLFITIVVSIIKGIVRLIENRKNLTLNYSLPTLVYLLVPFLPLPSIEVLESEVVLRGCYEGTMNQSYVSFRKDHSFEIHATSISSSDWNTGHWRRCGDTIWLNYQRRIPDFRLGRKAVIKDGFFQTLDESPKSNAHPNIKFYVGDCKHLN